MAEESKTWLKDTQAEARMEDEHLPFWKKLVENVSPDQWRDKTVLDFGCNRGGFLRMLHDMAPLKRGIGVDIAPESVELAKQRVGERPIEYTVSPTLAPWYGTIDLAFSYEVIYLVPDLQQHVAEIKNALKPGATYVAATGCHSDNPQWHDWTQIIERKTGTATITRSLNDFARAFHQEGFSIAARRLGYTAPVPVLLHPEYFPTVTSSLDYYAQHIIVFSFTKAV